MKILTAAVLLTFGFALTANAALINKGVTEMNHEYTVSDTLSARQQAIPLIAASMASSQMVSSNAAVAFLGTTVTSNDDTLALQSSAAGSAQNVGIQILDRTGEVLVLDGATFSAKTDLIDGTNILPFQARYIALGQSVAGTANADATFKVQYL
ncbi:fimbrial protein [Escherichia coli]|uniref:fimbrial protein n=1 Tax=Escherichia coli TaxID=562 RepID=UPI003F4DF452